METDTRYMVRHLAPFPRKGRMSSRLFSRYFNSREEAEAYMGTFHDNPEANPSLYIIQQTRIK